MLRWALSVLLILTIIRPSADERAGSQDDTSTSSYLAVPTAALEMAGDGPTFNLNEVSAAVEALDRSQPTLSLGGFGGAYSTQSGDYTVIAGYRDKDGRQIYLRQGNIDWGYYHIGSEHALWSVNAIRDTARFYDQHVDEGGGTHRYRRQYSRLECRLFSCTVVGTVWIRKIVNFSTKGVITAYCEGQTWCPTWINEY